jgi:hypothetical protein
MNAINVKYALIFTTLALAGCYSSSDTTNISDLRVLPQYKANMMAVEIRFETDRFISGKYDYPAIYATLTNTGNEDLSLSLSDLNIEADGAILSIVAPEGLVSERKNSLKNLSRLRTTGVSRGSKGIAQYQGSSSSPQGQVTLNAAQQKQIKMGEAKDYKHDSFLQSYANFISQQIPSQFVLTPNETIEGYISFERSEQSDNNLSNSAIAVKQNKYDKITDVAAH